MNNPFRDLTMSEKIKLDLLTKAPEDFMQKVWECKVNCVGEDEVRRRYRAFIIRHTAIRAISLLTKCFVTLSGAWWVIIHLTDWPPILALVYTMAFVTSLSGLAWPTIQSLTVRALAHNLLDNTDWMMDGIEL